MIEPEPSTAFRGFVTDNVSNGGAIRLSPTKNRNYLNTSPQNLFTTTAIINGGKWIFLSNRLVAYWPLSIKTTKNTRQKYLSFQYPTFSLFVTVIYILLNILYLVHYFHLGNKFQEDARNSHPFDLICLTIWDCMIIVGGTACRVYGIWRLSKLHSFWNNIVNIVSQFTAISSESETEEKFRKLRCWGLKWFFVFTFIGITNGIVVFYNDFFNHGEPLIQVIIVEYIDTVISSHNSSAFFLIFFVKIMAHGFTMCRRKLEEICTQNEDFIIHKQSYYGTNSLAKVFELIHDLEECVSSFNSTFVFTLLVEAAFSFWQIMFSLYFFHAVDPVSNIAAGINMMLPIVSYTTCLVSLCMASSKLTVECQEMVGAFQELSLVKMSADDGHKVQLLVARLTAEPPAIQVSQLFYIRESLLGSALNTLATYFIVLVQMRQIAHNENSKAKEGNYENLTEISYANLAKN